MDREIFVQNIKRLCAQMGIKPTVACRESGVGATFISEINRGQTPSVTKVQFLAQYLGVTTSELLGEKLPGTPELPDFLLRFQQLTPEGQKEVLAFIEFKMGQEQKP
ncbi:MAG: helix-turn-helix domain-containing protein [Lachnospiraceae bacterium]|nr:helix-turn-helix domain-containing protein [Lachnospiraceae bacterium]